MLSKLRIYLDNIQSQNGLVNRTCDLTSSIFFKNLIINANFDIVHASNNV